MTPTSIGFGQSQNHPSILLHIAS